MKKEMGYGLFRRGLYTLLATILIFVLFSGSTEAAGVSITPLSAVLYTGDGAEIFKEPDAATLLYALPGNMPVQVTGQTSNGFFEVMIDNSKYYIYATALSAITGTHAYKLTSIDAKAALVAEADTGKIIYEQNSMTRLAPASTTKMLTALLVMDAVSQGKLALDTPVVVSATALSGIPNDASHVSPRLKNGEVMNILELLECTLIKSDCHACNVLAEAVCGDVNTFVAMMNVRAAGLGCVDTNFVNTSGYPAPDHYTNAYSMYLITREAMKYEVIRNILSLPVAVIPATNLSQPRTIESTNELIKPSAYYNPYVIGGKTGSSNASGLCLTAEAVKDGKKYISVIFGARNNLMCTGARDKQQFSETNKLFNIAFAK